MLLAAAAVLAIVTQDTTTLRAAASATAPVNAILWQGEVLEVRGERLGYLQVYDYQRERAGYVLEGQVRQYPLASLRPSAVLETVRFLRDVPGLEALGIGHAALFLKIAPPREIDAEVFDALGTMADRLAFRASARVGRPGDTLAGHLDVARSYGLRLEVVEEKGRTVTCYDGDAFRRVLALTAAATPPAAGSLARAALGLSRLECREGTESERQTVLAEAAALLDRVPLDPLPPLLRHRVRIRRASVWASLAFAFSRNGHIDQARDASARAIDEIALVPRGELAEADAKAVGEAFVRVGVTRPASDGPARMAADLALRLVPRSPGETCLVLTAKVRGASVDQMTHCTYAVVWPDSVHVAPRGTALTVAIQPLAEWRELLVFRKQDGEWRADVISPDADLGLGYVEWAGWSPDGQGLLLAREVQAAGKTRRSFEFLDVATLIVKNKAERPQDLTPFHRWHSPEWRQRTLALL